MASRSGCKSTRSLMRASVRCGEKAPLLAARSPAPRWPRRCRRPVRPGPAPRCRTRRCAASADWGRSRRGGCCTGMRARPGRPRERGLQFVQAILRPFADELGGDVQIGRRTPVDARRGLEAAQQLFQVADHIVGQIQSGEQSHFAFNIVQCTCSAAILPRSFYARPTVEVARDLLGKVLVHGPTAGIIVETEAYLGGDDLAAHSARGITDRTRVIFGPPGHAYVYFIYGMYECLNLVAEPDGKPGCVLIRALEPVAGIDLMQRAGRRPQKLRATRQRSRKTHARHGDHAAHNGADVTRGALVVRDPASASEIEIAVTPRIGITQSADLPLRFVIAGNRFVSGRRRSAVMPQAAGRAVRSPRTTAPAPAATTASGCCRGGRCRARRAGCAGTPARRYRGRGIAARSAWSQSSSRSDVRNQSASGTPKPILGRFSSSGGRRSPSASSRIRLPCPPAIFQACGMVAASSASS